MGKKRLKIGDLILFDPSFYRLKDGQEELGVVVNIRKPNDEELLEIPLDSLTDVYEVFWLKEGDISIEYKWEVERFRDMFTKKYANIK